MNLSRRTFATMVIVGTVAVGAAGLLSPPARSDPPPPGIPVAAIRARSVVLVHGLYADGSSWIDVVPSLQAAGLNVAVVQNPLTTLADAAAETRRFCRSNPVQWSWAGILGRERWSVRLGSSRRSVRSFTSPLGRPTRTRTFRDCPSGSRRLPRPRASSYHPTDTPNSTRQRFSAISPTAFQPNAPARCVPCRDAIGALCRLSARPWPPGGTSRAGIRCPPRTGPSIQISNVFLPNGWARTRSNSIPRTFRSSLSPSRSPG
jgi:hypothetical protein